MAHRIFRPLFVLILVLTQFATNISPALAAAPANDNFADAEGIASLPANISVDNTGATAEANEPYGCVFPSSSVWYSFTVPADTAIQVNMTAPLGGAVDVFHASGPSMSDLTLFRCTTNGNSINLLAETGQTYYIRMDTYGQTGNLQLSIEQITPPANDNFSNAESILSFPFNVTVDNTNATPEAGEPLGCNYPFRSVWYSITPAENMAIQVTTTGGAYADIFSSTGATLADLSYFGCAFSNFPANVQLDGGSTYYLRLDSSGQAGTLQVGIEQINTPPNDRFDNAQLISSFPFTATADNTNATLDIDEPPACGFLFRTLWYTLTPAADTAIRVDMNGSPGGGLASVFLATGPAITDLSSMGCASNIGTTNFQLEAGQTYYLRIDSFGQAGSLQLNIDQIVPPPNDNFANAENVDALPFTASADNTNATAEIGEPQDCSFPFRSVWYSITLAEAVAVQIYSPSGNNISIFQATGPAFTDLSSIGCASGGNASNIQLEAGATYYLRLDSSGQPGVLQLSVEQIFPPGNDNFADAESIGNLPFNTVVDNTNSTVEANEPAGCSFTQRSVWYSFRPAEDMAARLNFTGGLMGSAVDVFLASGPSLSDLTSLGCALSGSPKNLRFEAGKTYYLRVGSIGQPGELIQFSLEQIIPPGNDDRANAEAINTLPFTATVDNRDATFELNEPLGCDTSGRSVWYSFTASQTMQMRIDTAGSNPSATVTVYESSGPAFSDLSFLTCAVSITTSFQVQAGKTYYLQLDSSGQIGALQLNLRISNPPPNDNLADAEVIGQPFHATVDSTDASGELNEPQPCFYFPNTVWYTFTPSETMTMHANTIGSTVDASVNIYVASGSGFQGLQFIGCSGPGSSPSFLAETGKTYYFQVGTVSQPGSVQFNLAEVVSITGRVTDAVSGAALPGNNEPFAAVYLYRVCGDACLESVSSQATDSEGKFSFDRDGSGNPLPAGSYQITATATLYATKQFGPFEFTGSNLDVGDLALPPPSSIGGRVMDAKTGNPIPTDYVELFRCDSAGCGQYVNSQYTDSEGRFRFDRFYDGNPLTAGSYELGFSSNPFYQTKRVAVTVGDGENRDLGDIPIDPFPLIGSISGRMIDAATGKPVLPAFAPQVSLYRCEGGEDNCFFLNSTAPGSDGRFRFETDSSGNHLISGSYRVYANADQFFTAQADALNVGENENRNLGDIKISSVPVRFSELKPCAVIPASGGDCVFSVKISNGTNKSLSGKVWSMADATLPETFARYTNFQVKDAQDLGLGKGNSQVFKFRFTVPANTGSYGTFICSRIFVGEGSQAQLNTIGFRELFCVIRNASGFALASPAEVAAAVPASAQAAAVVTGTEVEPNNSCQASQDAGTLSDPFVMPGDLDSSVAPDVDFFRFTGTPGLPVTIDLEGQSTGTGTLGDPYLGVFDSNCDLVTANDNSYILNSHLEITIPADGTFVVAATTYGDWRFNGGGFGTYRLTIAPVQTIGSVSGVISDAVNGKALRGDAAPFAYVRLLRNGTDGFSDVNSGFAGSDGSFTFDTDSNGNPLKTGNYMIIASADQYEYAQTDPFTVGKDELYNAGKIPLKSFPVRFSDLQNCSIPSGGGQCDFSVRITNGLATKFSGKAWSNIDARSLGTFIGFSSFQTNSVQDVTLGPGKSTVLKFRFQVRGSVPDGATFCATAFVGQNPGSLFNTVGLRSLFCFTKGSSGFTLMSEQQMQSQIHQMEILQETKPSSFSPKK